MKLNTAIVPLAAALLSCALLAFASQAHATTASAARPLPESDYRVRPLCGPVGAGYAQCFAMELVPRTAAAQDRATPLGMTLNKPVKPANAASGAFGLRPQDLHAAYGLATKAPVPQTVGIVDAYDDPTVESDLAVYDKEFGLPECSEADGCFTKVNQQGQASPLPAYDSGWSGEIALDIETAHAVCQENCHIVLVEAGNATNGSLEAAEETAVRLGATEISNSFGSPEPVAEGSAFDHPGIAITASTGDYGYLNWDSSQLGFPNHPNYPASSPDVVAVGGTRLSLKSGVWEKETVWNDGSTLGGGYGAGGSGCSEGANAQKWQQEVSDWAQVGCGEKRAAADVAADGDPYSGIAVYEAGSWSTVGGTSLSSPIIAATFALAGGTGGVSYPAETLYGHLGSANLLHDVSEGSNGQCNNAFDEETGSAGCTAAEEEESCAKGLICRAAAGYDGPSGIGTPEGVQAFTPPTPTVQSISPSEGDLGTTVSITGEDLKGVVAVEFGGAQATGVVEDSPTELTVTAPAHAPGQVDVTVTTAGGTSAISEADHFTYLSKPVIANVEPAAGPTAGGTTVTIRGERLNEAQSVEFGGTPATGFVSRSANELTATAPAHPEGLVDVTVTTPEGTSVQTSLDHFAYSAPPIVSAVEPSSGSTVGGTTVVIRGEHLIDVSTVKFGDVAAVGVVKDSENELTVTSPAHAAGQVDVTVTSPGGGTSATSAADHFTYLELPVIDKIEPAEGPAGGGTSITIKGEHLSEAQSVQFGGTATTSIGRDTSSELTVASPAHAAGEVDVTVTTPVGTSETRSAIRFTYVAVPVDKTVPTIEGFPMEGRTLIDKHGSWENTPTSYTYQWLRCNVAGGECKAIPDAAEQDYTLGSEDVGKTIEVQETASNAGGSASANSAPSAEVITKRSKPFMWTGAAARSAGASAAYWTNAGNWTGGSAPSEALDIATLTLPSLTSNTSCANPPTDACYLTDNDVAGIEVEKISVDDRSEYITIGKPFTLGAGGIEASSSASNTEFVPSFRLPIALSASQAWSIDGGSGQGLGVGGLELEGAISGESHSLQVDLGNEGGMTLVGSPDDEVGTLTITGADPQKTGEEANKNGLLGLSLSPSTEFPQLNATDRNPVHLEDVGMIGAGTTGPLTVKGGLIDVAEPFPVEGTPFGSLRVEGPVSLDSATSVFFTVGAGTTPGDDYTQLQATGNVNLGDAQLVVLGNPSSPCASLPAGSELALVSTTGTLEGAFDGVPDGKTLTPCSFGEAPVLRISYTEHAVMAKSLGPVPYDVALPRISGVATGEETLTAIEGGWQNSPTSYEYQWLRCDAAGESCSPISGAKGKTYKLAPGDSGHAFRVEVTAHNAAGQTAATSAADTPPPPFDVTAPKIYGSAVEGETLTATEGGWAYASSYAYRWLRCQATGGDCSPISGATAQLYVLTSDDVGHEIEVEVTATGPGGKRSADSEPTAAVASGSVAPHQPPVSTAPPEISGNSVEGETLTTTNGSWEYSPTGYTYQWQRCGSGGCSDVGTDSSTYTLTSADVGDTVKVQVVAENAGGRESAFSAATAVIAARDTGGGETTTPGGGSGTIGGGGSTASGSGSDTTASAQSSGLPPQGPPRTGTAQAAAAALVKGATAEVKLTCTGGGACNGSLKLVVRVLEKHTVKRHGKHKTIEQAREIAIAGSTFSLPAAGGETLSLKLSGKGMALLRKAGKKGLAAKLIGGGIATRTLVLEQAPRKHGAARGTQRK